MSAEYDYLVLVSVQMNIVPYLKAYFSKEMPGVEIAPWSLHFPRSPKQLFLAVDDDSETGNQEKEQQ